MARAITIECPNADGPGPYMLDVISAGRSVRASVEFTSEPPDVAAKVDARSELAT